MTTLICTMLLNDLSALLLSASFFSGAIIFLLSKHHSRVKTGCQRSQGSYAYKLEGQARLCLMLS